jgi:pimeloyl-ACP methyl ester carboxylesterase
MTGTLSSKSRIAAAVLFVLYTCAAMSLASTRAPVVDASAPGAHEDVAFETYSPLAASDEQQRRLLTPLLAEALQAHLAGNGQALSEQSVDLARERFAYYVPTGDVPANGYRVLVFVPPWQQAALPHAWLAVLDRHATILVTAAASGNEENVIGRRIPLALAGYENIARRFRVDASRIWIGGLSGGSRVALRIALGYPDLFRGALLNAGSDRFGTPELPFPPAPLLQRFEENMRLVYATGTRDESNLATDRASRDSARRSCITNLIELPMRNAGHALLDAGTLDRALSALEAERSSPDDLGACRAQRARAVDETIARVEALLSRGDDHAARVELESLDARFGALALPRSLELARRIAQPMHGIAADPAGSR